MRKALLLMLLFCGTAKGAQVYTLTAGPAPISGPNSISFRNLPWNTYARISYTGNLSLSSYGDARIGILETIYDGYYTKIIEIDSTYARFPGDYYISPRVTFGFGLPYGWDYDFSVYAYTTEPWRPTWIVATISLAVPEPSGAALAALGLAGAGFLPLGRTRGAFLLNPLIQRGTLFAAHSKKILGVAQDPTIGFQ
jgi:hypothetical protein